MNKDTGKFVWKDGDVEIIPPVKPDPPSTKPEPPPDAPPPQAKSLST